MVASAVVLAQHSALFQLFLREILSTLLMQEHASTADHAQHSAPFQLFLRAEPSSNNKENSRPIYRVDCFFYYCYLAKPNERGNACVSECLAQPGPPQHAFLFLSRPIYRVDCFLLLLFCSAYLPLSRLANFVNCGSHISSTVPIGPFLCLAMIISATPLFSVSLL